MPEYWTYDRTNFSGRYFDECDAFNGSAQERRSVDSRIHAELLPDLQIREPVGQGADSIREVDDFPDRQKKIPLQRLWNGIQNVGPPARVARPRSDGRGVAARILKPAIG